MTFIEKRMENRGQGGFTLIELLVVIAILAILGGVAVFAVNGLTTNADVNACKVEKDTMKTAQQAAASTSAADLPVDFLDDGETRYWEVPATSSAALVKKAGAPGTC